MTAAKPAGDSLRVDAAKAVENNPDKTPTQAVRELLGFSQEELASRSGVSPSTIVGLEAGLAPDALLLATVACTLGIPQYMLLRS